MVLKLIFDQRLRLSLLIIGKTPWSNGTTHVIFEPLDFMFRTNGMPRAQEAHDCRDAGGRATQEQLPRSGAFQVCTVFGTWMSGAACVSFAQSLATEGV